MILDTCALLWLASGDKHLSRATLKEINAAYSTLRASENLPVE